MSTKTKLEILELINSVQNKNNHFVNISEDDLETIYKYVVDKDLDTEDTIRLLTDLAFI